MALLVLFFILLTNFLLRSLEKFLGKGLDFSLIIEYVFLNTIPAYFESIVINLLSNAIKYRRVNVPLTINIFCEQNDDYFILKFEDNGCGIDLDLHGDRIFGMYKTFHKNKDARGLGLFLIKNQIEAMQGKIKVDSFVNKGSTFTIFLRK